MRLGYEQEFSSSVQATSTLQSAMSFRVVGESPATTRHMEQSQRRAFHAASHGRWALVAHILAEFPHLATAKDEKGLRFWRCFGHEGL